MDTWKFLRAALLFAMAFCALAAQAQSLRPFAQQHRAAKAEAVTYLFPEQWTVAAGKPVWVALHFRVAPGLHINSHTPADDFLIPTTFSIPAGAGVRLLDASYPAGTITVLAADPGTKLSVYAGEFILRVRIEAAAGNHLVEGKLRYQACDNNQCMPAETAVAVLDVIGR